VQAGQLQPKRARVQAGQLQPKRLRLGKAERAEADFCWVNPEAEEKLNRKKRRGGERE